jgi:hypothetical protein
MELKKTTGGVKHTVVIDSFVNRLKDNYMKLTTSVYFALLLAGVTAAAGQERIRKMGQSAVEPVKPLQIVVDLRDGSRLTGVTSIKSLPIKTSFAKMDMPLKMVESITFEDDQETAKISCINGDEFRGVINLTTIIVSTTFDKIPIPMKDIARISTEGGSVKRGCVLYYSFDKDEHQSVADKSGKGNDGKVHGTSWIPQGAMLGARTFDGKSDYISVNYGENSGLFPTETPISVVAWFKTASATPLFQTIAATHFCGIGGDGFVLRIDTRSLDGKAFWWSGSNKSFVTSKSAVNDGHWHHAVGIWDSGNSLLYIDGVLQGKAITPGSLVYEHRASFQIGHVENNNDQYARDEFHYFKGTIDEVMIFNRALTGEEVQQLCRLRKRGSDAD